MNAMGGRVCLLAATAVATVALIGATGAASAAVPSAHRVGIRCGCETGGPPPPPTPHQDISTCQPVKLRHKPGWLDVAYGPSTTKCPVARFVVAVFWSIRHERHARVGAWACTWYKRSHAIECHGPHREFAEGFWVPRIA